MEEERFGLMKRKPVLSAFLVLLLGSVILILSSYIVGFAYVRIPFFESHSIYLAQFFVDMIGFLGIYLLMKKLGYVHYFFERRVGFFKGLAVAGYFLVVSAFLFSTYFAAYSSYNLQPAMEIAIFVACMFAIGLAEETLCRGLVANILLKAFGDNPYGVRFSVLISGILFGLFHLTNLLSGQIDFTGVITQVVLTSAIGMTFTTIYYRTRNLWVVIFIHALNDFAALLPSGIFNSGSLTDEISSYSLVNLIGLVPQFIIIIFLLRPKGMEQILGTVSMEQMLGVDTDENVIKSKRKFYLAICCYLLAIIIAAIRLAR